MADEASDSEEGTRHRSPMAGLVVPWEPAAVARGLLLHLLQPSPEESVGHCTEQGLLHRCDGLAGQNNAKQP